MSDDIDSEANFIGISIPTSTIGDGPTTMVRVILDTKADVSVPVTKELAEEMISVWREEAEKRADPRGATKDAVIGALTSEAYFADAGMTNLAAAVLYLACLSSVETVTEILTRGGSVVVARITSEGGENMFRFSLGIE